MSNEKDQTPLELPEAQIEKSGSFSLIWLVPIAAALIGIWLIFQALSQKGPDVQVAFSHAEGIEAGKTRIRFKDVEIGKVKKVELNRDLSKVVVTAELDKSMEGHLSDQTRFWIVSPRISTNGISGLSTLLSGIYIAVDPGKGEKEPPDLYEGLESAPLIHSDFEGSTFHLVAENLGGLDIGSPIFYRQIEVGEVSHYSLDKSGHSVSLTVFIKAPYDRLVRSNTQFWNVTGMDIQYTPKGVTARFESIEALLSGGIAFETPHNLNAGEPSADGDYFPLFPNLASTHERSYSVTQYFVMHFDGSVRGLDVGADVEFRGMKVGEVMDIELRLNSETLDAKIPVLVGIHPELIFKEEGLADPTNLLQKLVDKGLRAQLKSGNLITGQLFIDLDFLKDAPPAEIVAEGSYMAFPTVPGDLEKITRSFSDLLTKVGEMPLEEIAVDLKSTIEGLNKIITTASSGDTLSDLQGLLANARSITTKLDKGIEPITEKITSSLDQVESTLATTEAVIGEDSALYYDLRQLVDEMTSAVRSFEALAEYLERNPNSLLYGKSPKSR